MRGSGLEEMRWGLRITYISLRKTYRVGLIRYGRHSCTKLYVGFGVSARLVLLL